LRTWRSPQQSQPIGKFHFFTAKMILGPFARGGPHSRVSLTNHAQMRLKCTALSSWALTRHSKLPGTALSGGVRRDSQSMYTSKIKAQELSRHQTVTPFMVSTRLQTNAADSTLTGVEKAQIATSRSMASREQSVRTQSTASKSTKKTRHIVCGIDSFIKAEGFRSQDFILHNIKSCIVTLLSVRTFYSILACFAFGVCSVAFIHLMLGLLVCLYVLMHPSPPEMPTASQALHACSDAR